jgi:hypothetical protein
MSLKSEIGRAFLIFLQFIFNGAAFHRLDHIQENLLIQAQGYGTGTHERRQAWT